MPNLNPDEKFARDMSVKTNPYQAGNYAGDVSHHEWLDKSIFTLHTYTYKLGDLLEESNHAAMIGRLSDIDPGHDFFANEDINSWLTPFERLTIYPYGVTGDQPFNSDIVAVCRDIFGDLEQYLVLDEDDFCQRESDQFYESLDSELSDYDKDDPIWDHVWEKFGESSGDYDDFLYNVLPGLIEEYEYNAITKHKYLTNVAIASNPDKLGVVASFYRRDHEKNNSHRQYHATGSSCNRLNRILSHGKHHVRVSNAGHINVLIL